MQRVADSHSGSIFMQKRLLLVAVLVCLTRIPCANAAPEPLVLSDGSVFETGEKIPLPHAAKNRIGQVAWVAEAGFRYRSRPGPSAPELEGGRASKFMD